MAGLRKTRDSLQAELKGSKERVSELEKELAATKAALDAALVAYFGAYAASQMGLFCALNDALKRHPRCGEGESQG